MNKHQCDVSGFFMVEKRYSVGRKVAWAIVIAVLGTMSILLSTDPPEQRSTDYYVFWAVTAIITIVGVTRMFRKPVVCYTGVRVLDSCFEVGTLAVNPANIDPKGSHYTGKVIRGNWVPKKSIHADSYSFIVCARQPEERLFVLDKLIITSKDKVLYQTCMGNPFYRDSTDMPVFKWAAMLYGVSQSVGGGYGDFVAELERIADVLSSHFADGLSCTLALFPKTVPIMKSLPFGLIGALISAGINYSRKKDFYDAFKENRLFSADSTAKLQEFLERRHWKVSVAGK